MDALVLRNYGVNHRIVGRWLDLSTAHALMRYASELGVLLVHAIGSRSPPDAADGFVA